jgi:hypothetical protein
MAESTMAESTMAERGRMLSDAQRTAQRRHAADSYRLAGRGSPKGAVALSTTEMKLAPPALVLPLPAVEGEREAPLLERRRRGVVEGEEEEDE